MVNALAETLQEFPEPYSVGDLISASITFALRAMNTAIKQNAAVRGPCKAAVTELLKRLTEKVH